MYGQNDKENGVDFYNSVFPGEVKMCLGFMSFRAVSAALKLPKYVTNYNLILGAIEVHETSHFDYRFKIVKRTLSLLYACFIFRVFYF